MKTSLNWIRVVHHTLYNPVNFWLFRRDTDEIEMMKYNVQNVHCTNSTTPGTTSQKDRIATVVERCPAVSQHSRKKRERDVYFSHFYHSIAEPLLLQNIKMEIQKPALSRVLTSRDWTFLQDDEQDRAKGSDQWYLGNLQEISEKWTPVYQHVVTELSLDRRL